MDKLQRKITPVSPIHRHNPFSRSNIDNEFVSVISDICRRVYEICAFLGFCAA